MGDFFKMDNPFMSGLSKIINCIYLSVLWLLFCIPLFTIGASTSALYYTVQKVIKNDRGYIWTEFFGAFRSNFKQSTLIWLIISVLGIIFYLDIQILNVYRDNGNKLGHFSIVFYVFLIFESIWCIYIFPYLARFKNKWKAVMKNAALMAIIHLPKTVPMFLICAVTYFCIWIMPISIFILPSIAVWLISYFMEKIFRGYMTDEERALEDEMNQNFKN